MRISSRSFSPSPRRARTRTGLTARRPLEHPLLVDLARRQLGQLVVEIDVLTEPEAVVEAPQRRGRPPVGVAGEAHERRHQRRRG